MAKQTFTTGSVLTATQMNDLQTNDFNQTVSQKTASYVLVAADKGTRIEMNAPGATTVTVNTGLFNAGDTLFIQNIGAGACTVTAGTATVNKATAGSLTLSQYQGGTLYFVSASSAIFFADAGYTPPLTTKGDLFTYSTDNTRLAVGTNGQYLSADSTAATGLKWASVATTKNFSLINAGGTALTAATTITYSGLSGYDSYMVQFNPSIIAGASADISIRFNSDSGSNYGQTGFGYESPTSYSTANMSPYNTRTMNAYVLHRQGSNTSSESAATFMVTGANTAGVKILSSTAGVSNAASATNQRGYITYGFWNNSATITSISVISSSGNFTQGTMYIYGAA